MGSGNKLERHGTQAGNIVRKLQPIGGSLLHRLPLSDNNQIQIKGLLVDRTGRAMRKMRSNYQRARQGAPGRDKPVPKEPRSTAQAPPGIILALLLKVAARLCKT